MPSSRWTGECETNIEQEHSPLSRNCADKSFVFEGAVSCVFWRWPAGQLWILLGKGGVAAPSSKRSRSFGGAAGVVRSTSDNRWLEPTTPSAPAKEASRHFLSGRSHPSLSKEGTSAFPSAVFNAPVSSKRCGPSSRGLTTPSAPTLVAFGIIFLMARPPQVPSFARGIRCCSTFVPHPRGMEPQALLPERHPDRNQIGSAGVEARFLPVHCPARDSGVGALSRKRDCEGLLFAGTEARYFKLCCVGVRDRIAVGARVTAAGCFLNHGRHFLRIPYSK